LTRFLSGTYAVFPESIEWSFGLLQNPLPPLIVKYVQLNWAAAGFAKITPSLIKCYTSQSGIDRFGEDAFFTLNANKKGKNKVPFLKLEYKSYCMIFLGERIFLMFLKIFNKKYEFRNNTDSYLLNKMNNDACQKNTHF
jgi:hypothetical protein